MNFHKKGDEGIKMRWELNEKITRQPNCLQVFLRCTHVDQCTCCKIEQQEGDRIIIKS